MRPLKSEKGQVVMEAVLLLVVLFGVFYAAMKQLDNAGYLEQIVGAPAKMLAATIESGVDAKTLPPSGNQVEAARSKHPNHRQRGASYRGDLDL